MRQPVRLVAGGFFLVILSSSAAATLAAVHCVPLEHPGACATRHATIAEAVAAASNGDTVEIGAGTYVESLAILGKSLIVRGARAGEAAPGRVGPETRIEHPGGPLIVCSADLLLDGLTLSGTTAWDGNWAALTVDGTRCPAGIVRIENTIVRDNIWGITVGGHSVALRRSWIVDNDVLPEYSQGVILTAPAAVMTLEDNTFAGHAGPSVLVAGPALYVTLTRNRFDGAVVLQQTSDSLLRDNVFVAAAPGGVLVDFAGDDHRVTLEGNAFVPLGGRAVRVAASGPASSELILRDNCLGSAGDTGLEVEPGAHAGSLAATSNWWGASSGPSGGGPGSGSALVDPSGLASFAPFLATPGACGCVDQPDGTPCDDGDGCTVGDACSAGACAGGPRDCEDGDSCTVDTCSAGACTSAPRDCGDASPCTSDHCDAAQGCIHEPLSGTPCNDGQPCTTEVCQGGICVATPKVCNDENPCTDDACNPTYGTCSYVPNDANTCANPDDQNPCTLDRCVGGACVTQTRSCPNDGNFCTDDVCDPVTGLCGVPDDTNPCYPSDACKTAECQGGTCVMAPLNCDDGLACTVDTCVPWWGYGCQHAAPGCDDNNPCTTDLCDDAGGCTHTAWPDGSPCEASSCMVNETCSGGVCTNGTLDIAWCRVHNSTYCNPIWCDPGVGGYCHDGPRDCDDGSACTADFCVELSSLPFCGHSLRCETDCEVPGFRFVDKTQMTWSTPRMSCDPQPTNIGTVRVLRGQLKYLPVGSQPVLESCLPIYSNVDTTNPESGEGFWYLVRLGHYYGPISQEYFTYGHEGVRGAPSTTRSTTRFCE